jgi:hypothetical protein
MSGGCLISMRFLVSFASRVPNAYPEARREEIVHAYQERSSLRGLSRTFGVSRATVSSWIKKKELSFRLYVPLW